MSIQKHIDADPRNKPVEKVEEKVGEKPVKKKRTRRKKK